MNSTAAATTRRWWWLAGPALLLVVACTATTERTERTELSLGEDRPQPLLQDGVANLVRDSRTFGPLQSSRPGPTSP